ITPEIPRAKDAQDVGFRWVSFTRASPPKVGQFWMRANKPGHVLDIQVKQGCKLIVFEKLRKAANLSPRKPIRWAERMGKQTAQQSPHKATRQLAMLLEHSLSAVSWEVLS
ncbi:hypothetical protein, partial [Stenotrophomonas maltophilia]|uniref:hypothetical protein n=1 Tax=Stenotrophomonas maltophilia TaxID=40324 RepID=UPI001A7E18D9